VRALVPNLENPHPLGFALPAVYHEDPLVQRFLSAFDEVMAPIFCTLDNVESYFDPQLTPPDFLNWLAHWVGLSLDEHWPLERRRSYVADAVTLYRLRGTVRGLAAQVQLHTGAEPEIEESGAIAWSSTPGGPMPGAAAPHVLVRVRVPDPATVNVDRLVAMIRAAIPADVVHELEVLPA
jgi:phage tail-like protein